MKHNTVTRRILAALLLLMTLTAPIAATAQSAPVIIVQSVPKLKAPRVKKAHTTRPVKGKVKLNGLKARDYAIIAFIDNGQWIKPYWKKYLTKIKPNGSFSVKITTNTFDRDVDEFRLFMVKMSDFKGRSGYPSFAEVLEKCVADTGSLTKSGFYIS